MDLSASLRSWLCLSLAVMLGCSETSCSVSGRVTLDGKPLSNGSISLRPLAHLASSRPVSAEIDHGKFSFSRSQDILPGSYVVSISAWRKTGRQLKVDEAEPLDEHEQYLPDDYNSTSKLSVEIPGTISGLLFELTMPEPESDAEVATSNDDEISED